MLVACNDVLQFFYGETGNYNYSVVSGGSGSDDGNGGPALVATSPSVGIGVNGGASGDLRGAQESNRLL